MASCQSSYFPKKLFTKNADVEWQQQVGRWPINPANAECERYDTSRKCPLGPCGARTGWAFIPGQISQWRWSTDTNDITGAPFFTSERPINYCGNMISPKNSHLS